MGLNHSSSSSTAAENKGNIRSVLFTCLHVACNGSGRVVLGDAVGRPWVVDEHGLGRRWALLAGLQPAAEILVLVAADHIPGVVALQKKQKNNTKNK